MINSKVFEVLSPLIEIIKASIGKTIGEIKSELNIERENMKKGASGLIVENLLGKKNNNEDEPDIPEIGCEIKVLPLQKNRDGLIKAKEPTQIQMINYFQVNSENWDNAKIRRKINLTFWIVYLAKINSTSLLQDDYRIVDFFVDQPNDSIQEIFKKDWEAIKNYIKEGLADRLSCSMGTYIEPKTKGKNNQDLTPAPDGHGGKIMVRRRAFYYKKNYTNTKVIPNLNLSIINE